MNTLIFQHIPKTAGTSLKPLVTAQFERKRSFICGSSDGVLKDFIGLKADRRNELELLFGHVDYGIHKHFNKDTKYIAFLRDPVERVVSHYYFIKFTESHRHHSTAQSMNIDEFILSGIRPRMNNCMVRMISGINPQYGACKDHMLDQALENLDTHYAFVGSFSNVHESIGLLTRKMNWNPVVIERTNATKNKPDIENLPKKTLDLIRNYNALDIKLYNLMRPKLS